MATSTKIARIHIKLDYSKPVIWRRVEVPTSISLAGLNDIIKIVMHFTGAHLYEFRVGDKTYSTSALETLPARDARLDAVIAEGIKSFKYVNDLGCEWRHTVTIEAVEDVTDPALQDQYPRFVGGRRRAPPEEVDGIGGFKHFLDVMATGPDHEDYEDIVDWHEEPFDPGDLDLAFIEKELAKLAQCLRVL